MSTEPNPLNQERDARYNAEPGIIITPGSAAAKEYAKFEQFYGSRLAPGEQPGNPYVKREFPKMLYRAEKYNGKVVCMAAPPDPAEFKDPREWERAEVAALKFTEKCQLIVRNETELSRAVESGWRMSPEEAVAHVHNVDNRISEATAIRNWEDRNMSEMAKREIAQAMEESGGEHQPEIKERRRRRKSVA